ncbi:reverse transcriptase domain-containing protein [Tanacetum coccineum]
MLKVSRIAWLLTNQIGTKNDKISALRKPLMNGSKQKSKKQIDVLTKKCQEEGTKEVSRSSVSECRAIYANNDSPTYNTLSDETNELHEASSTANLKDAQDEEDVSSKILPCQLPTKELNLGSFTLPCTIGSLNFYAMADLGASVFIIPKSMFKFLKLIHLKKTNMLVEMADMTKKVPIRIVENLLVMIDKFLFPSDFMVIDMLEARNETVILRRPFLATSHDKINVFNRITFNMNKKIHNFTTPVKKVHDCNETFKIWPTYDPTKKVCNGGEDIYGIDENGKLREWYCRHDDKRSGLTGEGLSFPDFLLVKYRDSQGPIKDPRSRSFDDYKWVFDLEIDQLADEYELGIGKKGHILEEI